MVRKTKGRRRRTHRRRRRTGGQMKPTIIRFWMNGCGACQKSEPEWTKFEQEGDDGVKKVKIESSAIPPQWSADVQAFPTYIVVVDGEKVAREVGAGTDLGKLKKVAMEAVASKKSKKKN